MSGLVGRADSKTLVLFQAYSHLGWETDLFITAHCGMCFSWGQAQGIMAGHKRGSRSLPPQRVSYQTLEKAEGTAGANKELQDGTNVVEGRRGK